MPGRRANCCVREDCDAGGGCGRQAIRGDNTATDRRFGDGGLALQATTRQQESSLILRPGADGAPSAGLQET